MLDASDVKVGGIFFKGVLLTYIAKSPASDRVAYAGENGTFKITTIGGQLQFETRTPSRIRAVSWPVPEKIYVLFENQQLKVIDSESAEILESFDNVSSCFAVADDGSILAGALRGGYQFIDKGRQIPVAPTLPAARSICFLDSKKHYAAALADGSILISEDGQELKIGAPVSLSGDYDAWIFAEPASGAFIVSQSNAGDGEGFAKTFIRKISYEGHVEMIREVRLADVRAVTGSPFGALYYEQSGIAEFSTGNALHIAAGYPMVAMVCSSSNPVKITGLKSDNTLINQLVTKN